MIVLRGRGPFKVRLAVPVWSFEFLIASFFLLIGLALIVLPISSGTRLPSDEVDGRFNFAVLEYIWRCLSGLMHGHAANFLDAPFFYPWPRVTNFADTLWGEAAPYVIARAAGAGEFTAYQIWFDAAFVLSYASAYWCLRKFGLTPVGAAVGAFLFTFALPVTYQHGHQQLLYRLWIPPAVLAFDRFIKECNWMAGAATILFIALQLAANIYLGLFLVLLLLSYGSTAVAIGFYRSALPHLSEIRMPRGGEIVITTLLLLGAGAILMVVAIPYFDVARSYGFTRPWSTVADGLPRLQSYFLMSGSRLWPDLSSLISVPSIGEQKIFPGLAAFVAVAWFAVSKPARERHAPASTLLISAAILTAITLDVGGYSIFRLIYPLPGFGAIRAVSRVILVTLFPLAALVGFLVDDLYAAAAHRIQWYFVAVLFVGFLVVESCDIETGSTDFAVWRAREVALEGQFPKPLPQDAVLAISAPPLDQSNSKSAHSWNATQVDAEVAAVTLGIHTINGYSGNFPPTWKGPTTCADVGSDIRAANHFFYEHGQQPPKVAPDQLVLIGFGPCNLDTLLDEPTLVLGHTYEFATAGDSDPFVGDGFSESADWGRWTEGADAYFYFSLSVAPNEPIAIRIKATSLSAAADRYQSVDAVVNGASCGNLHFATGMENSAVICPASALRSGTNTVHFRVANPARPTDLKLNGDARYLGMGIMTLNASAATCNDVGEILQVDRRLAIQRGIPINGDAVDPALSGAMERCDTTASLSTPNLLPDHVYRFAAGGDGNIFAVKGFSDPEPWGQWTDGHRALLYFALASAPTGPVVITIEATSVSSAPDRRQEATVDANGYSCGRLVIATGQSRAQVTCPASVLRDGENVVGLSIVAPVRPVDLHLNEDERQLGIGLITLTMSRGG